MARPYFDYEKAAIILVEALFYGDAKAARRHDCSTRSIRTYRARLETDTKLAELFQEYKRKFETDWIDELPAAIKEGIRFFQRVFENLDYSDPDSIIAGTKAFEILVQTGFTEAIVNERISRQGIQARAETNQMVTENGYVITDKSEDHD